MKCVYCSKCGTRLPVTRKALPKYGRIINLIEPHECPDELIEFDLTPLQVPAFSRTTDRGENTFVHNLNKLTNSHTENLEDRRPTENVKSAMASTAPRSLLNGVKSMQHVTPANDIKDEPRKE